MVHGSPLHELLVAREHGIDQLVQDVPGRLALEACVRIQRLVALAIEPGSMLHELLTARARLDQWHDALSFTKVDATVVTVSRRGARRAGGQLWARHGVGSTTRAEVRVSGRLGHAAGAWATLRAPSAGSGSGAAAGGRSRPGCFAPLTLTSPAASSAAQNAARPCPCNLLAINDIPPSDIRPLSAFPVYASTRPRSSCGEHCPEVCVPPPFALCATYAEPTRG